MANYSWVPYVTNPTSMDTPLSEYLQITEYIPPSGSEIYLSKASPDYNVKVGAYKDGATLMFILLSPNENNYTKTVIRRYRTLVYANSLTTRVFLSHGTFVYVSFGYSNALEYSLLPVLNSMSDVFNDMDDGEWDGPPPPPPSVSVPITYYPTGCVLQGPSEAEQGDTVNVLVTPGPGKIIKPESIQVYNRSGLITHTYASGILSFDVPDGQQP